MAGTQDAKAKPARAPRWNAETKALFFEEMAQTANIRQSAKAAGMSEAGAHRKKRADPSFKREWNAALAEGYAQIELLVLQRALAALQETTFASDGSKVAAMSERMVALLYNTHRQSVREYRDATAREEDGTADDGALARLEEKLDEMHERLADEE